MRVFRRRSAFALGLGALLTAAASVAAGAQRAVPAAPSLPPLVQTCPMHPDVVESKPGACPICRMNLVPTRLEASWMCPVHAAVIESSEGTCRLCGRSLVPVTVTLAWTCRGDVNAEHLEPGLCGDGSPRLVKRTLRPHGNHNPRHGGQFFMAPDNWHHLEGSYPRARLFRLHVYDDYARPLGPDALRRMSGHVVLDERGDPAARPRRDDRAVPLRVSPTGAYLEALLPPTPWPARLAARVSFKPGDPEYRFDFTFSSASLDPERPTPATASAGARRRGAGPEPTPARGSGLGAATAPAEPATTPPAPATIPDIVDAMHDARREIDTLVRAGDFAAIWVPAFRAKDLALTLEPHVGHLPDRGRAAAQEAVVRLVQAAWRLDAVGDTGNRAEVDGAFLQFDAAVNAVGVAFAP